MILLMILCRVVSAVARALPSCRAGALAVCPIAEGKRRLQTVLLHNRMCLHLLGFHRTLA